MRAPARSGLRQAADQQSAGNPAHSKRVRIQTQGSATLECGRLLPLSLAPACWCDSPPQPRRGISIDVVRYMLSRTPAIVLRQYYLMRGNLSRLLSIVVWVTIDIVLWGFITRYLNTVSSSGFN